MQGVVSGGIVTKITSGAGRVGQERPEPRSRRDRGSGRKCTHQKGEAVGLLDSKTLVNAGKLLHRQLPDTEAIMPAASQCILALG